MLTRLRVNGFKNLVDIDVRFSPFTCIAGANGVGKSNILDAIAFLSALSTKPLVEAALCVRDENLRTGDVRSLFHRVGESYGQIMSFSADMIIGREGLDDLGQKAEASSTYLEYNLKLAYRQDHGTADSGGLEILEERLTHIRLEEASRRLGFPFSTEWKKTALYGHRTTAFISTDEKEHSSTVIKIHQDGRAGAARKLFASNLPRTALSATTAAETPTATLAKREMQSWRLLQIEPSSLRAPDTFNASPYIGSDGAHVPATLYRMATMGGAQGSNSLRSATYARVANRLSALIDDVRQLEVERDEHRQLFTLYVVGRDGTRHPARSLSDGTLRFLALAVLEEDRHSHGLLCFEEPENGIHPKRIPAILELLQDIAVDTHFAVNEDNPLRQVLINTHSPAVVAQVREDTLLIAEPRQILLGQAPYTVLALSCLSSTWRSDKLKMSTVPKGYVIEYLSSLAPVQTRVPSEGTREPSRVVDRKDFQMSLGLDDDTALHAAK